MRHSDNGVDGYIAEFLPPLGIACDVGANLDGGSNTLMFEEMGWIVLCVEANPLLEPKGRKLRLLWRSVACGPEDGQADFYVYGDFPHQSYSGMIRHEGVGDPAQSISVPVRRLDRVLEEAGFSRLDLLTLDVEGYEHEVMKGFTVERWQPKVIVMEHWTSAHMEIPGYTLNHKMSFDCIYTRNA